ncbi:hypothetical protein AgCh_001571 [Apium graveolens]
MLRSLLMIEAVEFRKSFPMEDGFLREVVVLMNYQIVAFQLHRYSNCTSPVDNFLERKSSIYLRYRSIIKFCSQNFD